MSNPKQPWLIRYSYDSLDKLTSRILAGTPERQQHFYCKNRLATELQGAIGHSIVQHGDLLLAQQQYENNAFDTALLATDVQRSVLHTLKKNTERQAIAYSPYGHRTALNGLLTLLGFNGERPDPVTGHYLLGKGYRAFNPVLMRFNSSDSVSPFGKGGLNSYAYCLGDPINQSDPSGQAPPYVFNKATRTITTILGTSRELLPNVSNNMAKRTVKKMNRAVARVAQKDRDTAEFIKLDMERNYNPLTKPNEKLQTFAASVIDFDKRAYPSEIPQRMREFVGFVKEQNEVAKQFYNSITNDTTGGYAMGTNVGMLAYGMALENLIKPHSSTIEFAQKYQKRIAILRNASDSLSEKKRNLLTSITRQP
jgi:RHS repeat-associated protein